jgi:hypothetical protein
MEMKAKSLLKLASREVSTGEQQPTPCTLSLSPVRLHFVPPLLPHLCHAARTNPHQIQQMILFISYDAAGTLHSLHSFMFHEA